MGEEKKTAPNIVNFINETNYTKTKPILKWSTATNFSKKKENKSDENSKVKRIYDNQVEDSLINVSNSSIDLETTMIAESETFTKEQQFMNEGPANIITTNKSQNSCLKSPKSKEEGELTEDDLPDYPEVDHSKNDRKSYHVFEPQRNTSPTDMKKLNDFLNFNQKRSNINDK